jgi:hypothetical protein
MRLTRIISVMLAVSFAASCVFPLTIIKGRILGSDGKPMQAAHISLLHPNDTKVIKTICAEKNGKYSLSISKPGIWMLHAAGVGFRDKWVALYIEKEKNVQLDICLGGYRYLSNLDRAAVVGDFNNWYILKATPMKVESDGILNAEVKSIADTIAYRLINIRDGDAIEGMQADRYVYDPAKGYISVLNGKKEKKIKISFNSQKLPKVVSPSKVIFANPDAVISKFASIIDTLQNKQDLAQTALINQRRSFGNNSILSFEWAQHISNVENQIKDEKISILRQALFMSYLTMCMAAKRTEAAIYRRIVNEIPPTSIIWVMKPHNLFYAVGHSGMTDAQQEKYMDAVIEHHSSKSVKIAALFDMYMASKLSDQKEKAAKYYNLLEKRYGRTEEGRTIISRFPIR